MPQRRGDGFYQGTGQAPRAQGQTRSEGKSLRWVKRSKTVAAPASPGLSLSAAAA